MAVARLNPNNGTWFIGGDSECAVEKYAVNSTSNNEGARRRSIGNEQINKMAEHLRN